MGALKIVIPLVILAGLVTFILPMVFIWFVNDIENNVTVTGDTTGVWTVFQHGMNMMATIFGESAWVIGIILIVLILVILLGSVIIVVKRMAT